MSKKKKEFNPSKRQVQVKEDPTEEVLERLRFHLKHESTKASAYLSELEKVKRFYERTLKYISIVCLVIGLLIGIIVGGIVL